MEPALVDSTIRTFAAGQHGVMTIAQCRSLGVSTKQIQHRLDRGVLERLSPVVVRLAGSPATPVSEALAAVLDVGLDAVLSHDSAAAMWGLPGFDARPHHVIGVRDRPRRGTRHLAIVHEPRVLLDHHVTALDGVSLVTPTRLLFDLAGARWVHSLRLERTLDTALSRRLVSVGSLERVLSDLARRGRRGIAIMRELIEDRRGLPPADSNLERRFEALARRAGLTGFVRQVDVGDDAGWIGRVDFVDPERRIVVETDTALHHGSLTDRRRDDARRHRLRSAGWVVHVFTDTDIFHRADLVVAQLALAAGVAQRRAG